MKMTVRLADREAFIVDTRPIDNVRFEDTARRHKWGSVQDVPMKYMYFTAYAACTRSGEFDPAKGFEAFLDVLVDVDPEADSDTDAPDPLEAGGA